MNANERPGPGWKSALKEVTGNLAALAFLGTTGLSAQNPSPVIPPSAAGIPVDPWTKTNATLKVVRPGVYALGEVELHREAGEIRFPAELNWSEGPIEYALVTDWGKVHESILRTRAHPIHVHSALLLLGAKVGAITNLSKLLADARTVEAGTRGNPLRVNLPGLEVSVSAEWTQDGKRVRRGLHELIESTETGPLSGGLWIYSGSRLEAGEFSAQTSGSLISLISDADALVNSLAPGHERDEIWGVRTNQLPPPRVPVTVVLTPSNKRRNTLEFLPSPKPASKADSGG